MKKSSVIVGSVALALVCALLALPYGFGIKTESTFNERLDALANKSGLQLSLSQFKRGWLSSHAETVWRVPGAPIEITALHTIHHGPFAFERWWQGDFDATPMQARIETHATLKIQASDGATSPTFSIDTTIALNGAGYSRIQSPALKHQTQDGNTVEWQGLQGNVRFDSGARHVRTDLRAPRFVYATGSITDIRFHADLREGVAGHYLGKTTLDIDAIAFAPLLQLKKMRIASDSIAYGENLAINVSYDVAEMQVADNRYGPLRLALEIRKLDAEVLARFQDDVHALQRSGRPAEQLGLMQLGKLLQLVGQLAKKAPELEVTELRLRIGGDEIVAKAKFVLDGSKTNLAENPLLILTTLAGDAEISLPPSILKPILLPLLQADMETYRRRGLLKKTGAVQLSPAQLSVILDQALPLYLPRHEFTRHLVADGNRYRLNASLRRGQVLVNGEPLNLSGAAMLPPLQ